MNIESSHWPENNDTYYIDQDKGRLSSRAIYFNHLNGKYIIDVFGNVFHGNYKREQMHGDVADYIKQSLVSHILNSGGKIPDGFMFLRDCLPNPHQSRLKRVLGL